MFGRNLTSNCRNRRDHAHVRSIVPTVIHRWQADRPNPENLPDRKEVGTSAENQKQLLSCEGIMWVAVTILYTQDKEAQRVLSLKPASPADRLFTMASWLHIGDSEVNHSVNHLSLVSVTVF